jgi:hypothetical protein
LKLPNFRHPALYNALATLSAIADISEIPDLSSDSRI